MTIDIYSNYNVTIEMQYSCIDEESSTPGETFFKNDNSKSKIQMNAGKIIDLLENKLSEDYILEIKFKENQIILQYFNPLNGEGSDETITFERIEGKNK